MKKTKKAPKTSKIAIILDGKGAEPNDVLDMLNRTLDQGLVQDVIHDKASMTDDCSDYEITSASAEHVDEAPGELEAQRDALAAELVVYADVIATICDADPGMKRVLDAKGIDKNRIAKLAAGKKKIEEKHKGDKRP